MALDFSKLGTGQTVDTVLKPREIFNALPNKNQTNSIIHAMCNLKYGASGLTEKRNET